MNVGGNTDVIEYCERVGLYYNNYQISVFLILHVTKYGGRFSVNPLKFYFQVSETQIFIIVMIHKYNVRLTVWNSV